MHVQKRNDNVSIYCLSSGSSLPEWLSDHSKRNLLKRDEGLRRRIELLQDFTMPTSSTKLMQSFNGQYIIAAGTYQPRIKCYDVNELSCKYERYIPSDCIDMSMLSSNDDSKIALLCNDRTIQFHAPYGKHEIIRIPTFGRAMTYEPTLCQLYVASRGNHLHLINLQDGRFHEPYQLNKDETSVDNKSEISGTSIAINPLHPLLTVGCDDGIVRFYDNRGLRSNINNEKNSFLNLNVYDATKGYGYYDTNETRFQTQYPGEITSIAHDASGLYMAFGMSCGLVSLYDIRSSRPLYIQEHKNGTAIHTIHFHSTSGHVLSSDERLIKIWKYKKSSSSLTSSSSSMMMSSLENNQQIQNDPATSSHHHDNDIGSILVNVESTSKLSHFIVAGDETDASLSLGMNKKSGLLLCATDQPKMESYYIPSLGIAPKWCNFLDNITEELEERDLQRGSTSSSTGDYIGKSETTETVFENYKFITNHDIETLGIQNLIGTPLLRGYMHGFFIDIQLYNRLKAVVNPFEYEEYQKKKLKEKLELKRATRITPKSKTNNTVTSTATTGTKDKVMKVNPDLANRLINKAKDVTKKSSQVANTILGDDRFGSLFTNPDYQINEDDETFRLRNPSGISATKQKNNNLDSDDDDDDDDDMYDNDVSNGKYTNNRQNEADNDDDDDDDNDSMPVDETQEHTATSDSDDSGLGGVKIRGENYEEVNTALRRNASKPIQKFTHSTNKEKSQNNKTKKIIPKLLNDSDDDGDNDYYDASYHGKMNHDDSHLHQYKMDADSMKRSTQKKNTIMKVPLAERLQERQEVNQILNKTVSSSTGSKEISYIPTTKSTATTSTHRSVKRVDRTDSSNEISFDNKKETRDRRGIKDLGIKRQKTSITYHSKQKKK